jgi:hypothetical protein
VFLEPFNDVPRSAKLALSDFLFEFLTLGLVEPRHTAFVVQFAQRLQPVGAVGVQPPADLPGADAQSRGNLLHRYLLSEPQQGGQSTPDARVTLFPPSVLDLLLLVVGQFERHRLLLPIKSQQSRLWLPNEIIVVTFHPVGTIF